MGKRALASGTCSAHHFGSRSWEDELGKESPLFDIQVEGRERSGFQFLNDIIFSLHIAQRNPNYTKP